MVCIPTGVDGQSAPSLVVEEKECEYGSVPTQYQVLAVETVRGMDSLGKRKTVIHRDAKVSKLVSTL